MSWNLPRPPTSSRASSGHSATGGQKHISGQRHFRQPRTVDGWLKATADPNESTSRSQPEQRQPPLSAPINVRAASARAMTVVHANGEASVFAKPLSAAKRQLLTSVASSRPPPEHLVPLHLRAFAASDAYRGIMARFEEQKEIFSSAVLCADAAFREVCDATANDSRRGRPHPIRAAVACGLLKRLLPESDSGTNSDSGVVGGGEAGRLTHELLSEIARAVFDLGDASDAAAAADEYDDDSDSDGGVSTASKKQKTTRKHDAMLLDDRFEDLMLRPLYFQQVAVVRDDLYLSRASERKLRATIEKQKVILDQSIDRWQRMLTARVFHVWRRHTIRHRTQLFEGRYRLLSRAQARRLSAKVFSAWRAVTAAANLKAKKDEIRHLTQQMQRAEATAMQRERDLQAEISRLVDASEALSATVQTLRDDVADLAQQLESERRKCDVSVLMGDRWREACLQVVAALQCGGGAAASGSAAASGVWSSAVVDAGASSHGKSRRRGANNNNNTTNSDMFGNSSASLTFNTTGQQKKSQQPAAHVTYPQLFLLPEEMLPVAFEFDLGLLQNGVLDYTVAKELGMVPAPGATGRMTIADLAMAAALSAGGGDDAQSTPAAAGAPLAPESSDEAFMLASATQNAAALQHNTQATANSLAARRVAMQQQQEQQQLTARLSDALPISVLQVPLDRGYVFGPIRTGSEEADAAVANARQLAGEAAADGASNAARTAASNPFAECVQLLENAAFRGFAGKSPNSSPGSRIASPLAVNFDASFGGNSTFNMSVTSGGGVASPLAASLAAADLLPPGSPSSPPSSPAGFELTLARKLAAAPASVLLLAWTNGMVQQSPLVKRLLDTKRYVLDRHLHNHHHHHGRGGSGAETMVNIQDQQGTGSTGGGASALASAGTAGTAASNGGGGGKVRGAAVRKQLQLELSRVVGKCSLGDPAILHAILGTVPTLPAIPLPARNFAIDFSSGDVLLLLAEACGALSLQRLRTRYGVAELTMEAVSAEERERQERATALSLSLVSGAGGASVVMSCHPVVARILRARVVDVAAASNIKSLGAAEHELLLDALFALVVLSDPFDKVDLALRALHDAFDDPATTDMFVGARRNDVIQGLAPDALRAFVSHVFSQYVDFGVSVNLSHALERLLHENSRSSSRASKQPGSRQSTTNDADAAAAAKNDDDPEEDSITEAGDDSNEGRRRQAAAAAAPFAQDDRRALPLVVAPFAALAQERRGWQEQSYLCRLSSSVAHQVVAPASASAFPATLADSCPAIEQLLMRAVAARVTRAYEWRDKWRAVSALCREKLRREESGGNGAASGGSEGAILNADTQRELLDLTLVSDVSLRAVMQRFESYAKLGPDDEVGGKSQRGGMSESVNFALSTVRGNPHAPASMASSTRRGSPLGSPASVGGAASSSAMLGSSTNTGGSKKFEKPVAWIIAQCKPRGRRIEWPTVSEVMPPLAKVLRANDKKLRHVFYSYATRSVCTTVAGAVSVGVHYGLSHSQFRELVVECALHTKPPNSGLTKRALGALYDTLVTTRLQAREQLNARKAASRFAENSTLWRKRDAAKLQQQQQQQDLQRSESVAALEQQRKREVTILDEHDGSSVSANGAAAAAAAGGDDDEDDEKSGLQREQSGNGSFASLTRVSSSGSNFFAGLETDEANLPPGQLSLSDLSAILAFIAVSCAFADTKRAFDTPLMCTHLQALIDTLKMRSAVRRERDAFQRELDSFDVQAVYERHNKALRRAFDKAAGQDGDPEMDLDEWLFVMRQTRLQIVCGADACRDIFVRYAGSQDSSLLFRDFLDALAVIAVYVDPNPFVPLAARIKKVLLGVPDRALPGLLASMGVKTAGAE